MKKINVKGKRVLIIPDTHEPFAHQDYIQFLTAVKNKYLDESSVVIHLGDEIDGFNLSFHDPKDPDIEYSPSTEMAKAIENLSKLHDLFPQLYLCESNHGSLVYRRQRYAGIPLHCIKSYQEILGTPGWEWHEDYILETKMGPIYVCHGKTASSGKLVKEMGTFGAIQGHFHGKFQIIWSASSIGDRFDCYSGCLVDRNHLAFNYGKNHIPKPVLGCTIISKTGYPKLIKMVVTDENRWIWELP